MNRCRAFYERYRRPIFITETSAGHNDEEKIRWMRSSVETVLKLRQQNIAVVGYDWWPLFDAVQWTYRFDSAPVEEHVRPGGWNNGLYTIEKGFDGVFRRVKTKAADEYKKIIAATYL